MSAQNTIELDLECYKALESHRQSLDESALDILRRILLSADSPYKTHPADPAERSASAGGEEGNVGGGAPDRTSPTLPLDGTGSTLSPDRMSSTSLLDRTGSTLSPDRMSPTLPLDGTGSTLSPDRMSSTSLLDRTGSTLSPGRMSPTLPPDWQDPNDETERRTGNYLVQLGERACFAPSQKAAYRLGLIWLEKTRPGLLAALAHAGTRNRRIVAHSPDALYPRSPALAKHAEKLIDDWYVDVNLSKEQKLSRLKTACRHAGLMFGKDLIVDL
ncbi:hypothetical protein [Maricaulis sp.]|uniref:hypothetical protein n=2 Tax=Maricaulis sp. TaxID=1486257 RepID=UPI001AFE2D64|nr:hypothetical protein [Maricaulis sp.]MBO6764530.1 hypothetical protein [Maricaulis sp.]